VTVAVPIHYSTFDSTPTAMAINWLRFHGIWLLHSRNQWWNGTFFL